MSILNLIDGSYSSGAPVEVDSLQITLSTDTADTVKATFSKVGNICSIGF